MTIDAAQISHLNFRPYGWVIGHRPELVTAAANQGTALRSNNVTPFLETHIYNQTKIPCQPGINLFRATPRKETRGVIELPVLERHPFTTQSFIPVARPADQRAFVVVVADDRDGKPNLSTAKAFIVNGNQGITYNIGVWHSPLAVLDADLDCIMLSFENGVAQEDLEELTLPSPLRIQVSEHANL